MGTIRPIAAAALFLLALLPLGASHIFPVPSAVTDFEGRIALLVNTKWLDPLLQIEGRLEGPATEFRYRAITVGSYFRPLPNIKLGVFYRLQAGVRHDDDWVRTTAAPGWTWVDTTGRIEHQLIADVSPRFLLPFLPGTDWVFMLKTRYLLSSYQLQSSVMVRPTLTWFLMPDREPLLSLAFAYGLYFRLDTQDLAASVLYEHEPYFELLLHLGQVLTFELTGAFKTVRWSASQDLIDSGEPVPEGTFPRSYRSSVIGLGLLVRIAP